MKSRRVRPLLCKKIAVCALILGPGPGALAQISETPTSPFVYQNPLDITFSGDAVFVSSSGVGSFVNFGNSGALFAGADGIEILTSDSASPVVVYNQAPITAAQTGITGLTFAANSPIIISSTSGIDAGQPGVPQFVYGLPNLNASGAFNGGIGNVGAFNGIGNGLSNAGAGNGTNSGSNNTGAFNGSFNGVGNSGNNNGADNGNGNTGAFNGNWNGNYNTGNDNGSTVGNGNIGAFNGNLNGNENATDNNGNNVGNNNTSTDNGNLNGNGNDPLQIVNPGFGQIGIFALTLGDQSAIEVNATSVNAGMIGLFGETHGIDSGISLSASGPIRASDFGFFALTLGNDSDVSLVANGEVDSGAFGFFALALGDNSDVSVNANANAYGGEYGIFAAANQGQVDLRVAGALSSGSLGIFVSSGDGSSIYVAESGSISALGDHAIHAEGGAANVLNNGAVHGFFELTANADSFVNSPTGRLNARMYSDFGAGSDELINEGTLRAAFNPVVAETVAFGALESFVNGSTTGGPGSVVLQDSRAGDCLVLNGSACMPNALGLTFLAQGNSNLAVDTYLASAPDGVSDLLIINGDVSGRTIVRVMNTNPTPTPNFDGIPVVQVAGITSETDFDLEEPLSAGFFAWDLFLDPSPPGYDQHELLTVGLGSGAYEAPLGMTALQDIWHQSSASVWLDRQADLRICDAFHAAGHGQGAGGGEECNVAPGFWIKGQTAWVERDSGSAGYSALGRTYRFDLGYDLTLTSVVAGADRQTEFPGVSGTAVLGLMGGYLDANVDFESASHWTFAGPILGAYATYLNDGFYFDALLKLDLLDVTVADGSLGRGGTADARTFGARIDTGYLIDVGSGRFIEPQAMLGGAVTDVDRLNLYGGSVAFDEGETLRGRIGVRGGVTIEGASATLVPDLTLSLWREFAGVASATVSPPGFAATEISNGAAAQNTAEVAFGMNAVGPRWSAFARTHLQFGEDYRGVTARAGLRYRW